MADSPSFVQRVLATAGKMEKEDLSARTDQLSRRIEEVKYEVYDALQSQYEDFIPNLTATLELTNRVRSLSDDMSSISERIEREIQSQLDMSTTEFQDLSVRLQESNGILAVLDKLVQIYDALNDASRSLNNKEYVTCADSLDKIHTLLSHPINDRSKDIKILNALNTEYRIQREKLLHGMGEAWNELVSWMIPLESDVSSESHVEIRVCCSPEEKRVISNLVLGMKQIGILKEKMRLFAARLMKHVAGPIVKKCNIIVKESQCNEVVKLEVVTVSGAESSSPVEVFNRLVSVFDFVHTNIFLAELDDANITMRWVGNELAEELLECIVKYTLAPAIPTDTAYLEEFRVVIDATKHFQQDLQAKYDFIPPDCAILVDYVSNVNVLFANKKSRQLHEYARNLMTSEIHNMMKVTGDKPFGNLSLSESNEITNGSKDITSLASNVHLSANTFKLPDCYISESVQELVILAYKTMHDACSSSQQCAVQLYYAVRNMFELYCSVVPTYHKQSLATLPQISALHHNNCLYIAHHLMTLGMQFQPLLPDSLKKTSTSFVDFVPKIRQLGVECLMAQMTRQKEQLMEYLQGASEFASVQDHENYTSADRSIKQCIHQLNHLKIVWVEVLPTNIYFKAIGVLVNSVLVEIIRCVTSLEDMSADDANQLYSLLDSFQVKVFFELESEDEEAIGRISKYIPKYLKYEELKLVLKARLAEISDRWADGKGPLAVEFTSTEVKNLIRALFQNTEKRSAVLAKIKPTGFE